MILALTGGILIVILLLYRQILYSIKDIGQRKTNIAQKKLNNINPECNIHVPMSENGSKLFKGCCSKSCMKNEKTRNYNGSGNYQKSLNGYNPYIGYKNKSRKIKS